MSVSLASDEVDGPWGLGDSFSSLSVQPQKSQNEAEGVMAVVVFGASLHPHITRKSHRHTNHTNPFRVGPADSAMSSRSLRSGSKGGEKRKEPDDAKVATKKVATKKPAPKKKEKEKEVEVTTKRLTERFGPAAAQRARKFCERSEIRSPSLPPCRQTTRRRSRSGVRRPGIRIPPVAVAPEQAGPTPLVELPEFSKVGVA